MIYLKILACKSQEFLGNRYLLCYFPLEYSIHICTRFCSQFYHSHHLWQHNCCWPDHSQNSCHKKFELFILLSVWLQAEFNKMIRKLNLILLLIVWWQSLSLHDVMKFSNLMVQKIRFMMVASGKYKQNVWNILDTLPQYWWAV